VYLDVNLSPVIPGGLDEADLPTGLIDVLVGKGGVAPQALNLLTGA
jgi:hypothetical protein